MGQEGKAQEFRRPKQAIFSYEKEHKAPELLYFSRGFRTKTLFATVTGRGHHPNYTRSSYCGLNSLYLPMWGMVIPPFIGNPDNGAYKPLQNWVDDHPLSYGHIGSKAPLLIGDIHSGFISHCYVSWSRSDIFSCPLWADEHHELHTTHQPVAAQGTWIPIPPSSLTSCFWSTKICTKMVGNE